MKLSLAMICRDELGNLKRLYPLVKDYIDEWVVVVPPGDKAVEFLKGKAKVVIKDFTQPIEKEYLEQFKGYGLEIPEKYRLFNFAKARNTSFKYATGDYVLWLDADDEPVRLDKLREYLELSPQIDIFDALYDYSKDKEGNPISDHYRERIIRNNPDFKWAGGELGLIHETVVYNKFSARRLEIPPETFRVTHVAKEGHEIESATRNHIALLYEYLKTKGKDARTIYYLGVSFFNTKQYEHCIKVLQEYIKVGGWDEERYRAWIRIAEAYHQIDDKESSRNAYLNAIKELPDYPDAYLGLGESYFSDKIYHKAVEFLYTGLQKPIPQTKSAVDRVKYMFRPIPFLALAYIELGKPRLAYEWYQKAKKINSKHPWVKSSESLFSSVRDLDDYVRSFVKVGQLAQKYYPETLPKLAEAVPERIQDQELLLSFRRKYASPKTWSNKSIVYFCSTAFEDWGADSLGVGTGGSEEAVIQLTKRWARMGWEVTVYNNCPKEEIRDGVEWKRYEKFNPRDDFNILIAWRNNPFLEYKRARKKFADVHDVPNNIYYPKDSLADVTMMVKSQYHRNLYPQLDDANFQILPNGIDSKQFANKIDKIRNKMIWTSSLDRGLEYLLRIWPGILKAVPNATLDIYYGWQLWDKSIMASTKQGRQWKRKMLDLINQQGINFIGRVGTDEIARAYLRADVFPYPSDFPEISCISLMKAQAAGCIPVTSDYAAIKETNKYGIQVKGSPQDDNFMNRYKKVLIDLLKDDKRKERLRVSMSGDEWGWNLIAKQWDELFKQEDVSDYPLVSVIIPHLPEREEFLAECLESVKEQTYPHVEIIVEEDDGVGKPSVVKNRAIKRARGKWHYFLDDDDKILSRHSLMQMMKHQHKGDLIFSDTLLVFPDKEVEVKHWFRGIDDMMSHNGIPGVYLLRADFSKKILNDEALSVGEDHDRTVRLVKAGAKPYHVPQSHYWYRHHGEQIQYQRKKAQDIQTEATREKLK